MGDAEGEHEAAALIGDIGLRRCECESEIWTSCSDTRPARQEERQAQLCLARMPAVVPDTRPAPQTPTRWEAHAEGHYMHARHMSSNH